LSLTNLHNASSAGLSNSNAVNIAAVNVKPGKKGKGTSRQALALVQTHNTHNRISKVKKGSTSGAGYSSQVLRRGINRIG
ncbi:hypothetical protein NPN16_24675, partial [Vibrio parahaemolyticus]|uniref:hypothetical protein n=1 Tax=Vibrio parahaemolyticus TaxID=670 RepID=UPI00211357EF